MSGTRRLLFYSRYVFHKPLYAVFSELRDRFRLDGHIVTHEKPEAPKVYAPEGFLTPQSAGLENTPDFVTVILRDLPVAEKVALLKKKIQEICPDYIWAHEEPVDFYVNQMLRWFYFRKTPRILVHAVENIWPLGGGYRTQFAHLRRRLLWRRYDGVLAASTKSLNAIQAYGMPRTVPVQVAWLPHLHPPPPSKETDCCVLPEKREGEMFIGFAGRIIAAKGWRVLLAAMAQLPRSFRCLMAGTGDEEAELRLWCLLPELHCRLHYLGLLRKEQLWNFYRGIDILVLPSLTAPHWTEQLGSVLAEAMACGVPVIGSSSGAIPEVVGNCGMIVEENSPTALAEAIHALALNPQRRAAYAEMGLRRFEQEYSYKAYAAKVAAMLGLQ